MSLNWDLTAMAEGSRQKYPDRSDGEVHLVTAGLIYATMGVGMRGITARNAGEFWARLKVFQGVVGPLVANGDGTPRMITEDDVRAHVGLTTNATPWTREEFLRKQISGHMTDIRIRFNQH